MISENYYEWEFDHQSVIDIERTLQTLIPFAPDMRRSSMKDFVRWRGAIKVFRRWSRDAARERRGFAPFASPRLDEQDIL